jgi:hypothetical protein
VSVNVVMYVGAERAVATGASVVKMGGWRRVVLCLRGLPVLGMLEMAGDGSAMMR